MKAKSMNSTKRMVRGNGKGKLTTINKIVMKTK